MAPRMRRLFATFTVAAFALLLVACVPERGHAFLWRTVRALRVGMPDREVTQLMGGPASRVTSWSSGTRSLTWIYVQPGGSTRSVTLLFGPAGLLSVPDIPDR